MRSRGHDLYRMETGRCLTVSVIQFRICLHTQKSACTPNVSENFRTTCTTKEFFPRGANASLEGELIIGSMDHPLPHGSLSDNTSVPQKLTELTTVTLLTLGTEAVRLRRQQDLRDTCSFINNRRVCHSSQARL